MDENQKQELQNENKEINQENQNNESQEVKQEQQNVNTEISNNESEIISESQELTIVESETEKTAKKSKKKKEKKPRKGSYILGTIGALLGAVVAALPWVLTYIFAQNLVIALLAIFIPIGAFLGYKIWGGKVGKGFSYIISIISILTIILLTTVICPAILVLQSGYELTWDNVKGLYSETRAEIRTMIIEDSIIGLIFTVMGILMMVHFIRKQIKSLLTEEQIKAIHDEKKNKLKEQTQVIKNACLNFNSLNSDNAVKKSKIIKELVQIFNIKRRKAKLYFKNAALNGLLIKHKGKYYYDEANEEEKLENFKKIKKRIFPLGRVIIIFLLLAIAVVLGTYIYQNMERTHMVGDSGMKITIDHSTQDFYGTDEQITEAFGAAVVNYYDFILLDKNNKYELYGLAIPSNQYTDKDFATIMQEDRDYWEKVLGDEVSISDVETKQFGEHEVKEYHYDYVADSGKECKALIYLHEEQSCYLWINVYTDGDVELTQVDTIVNDLLK